MSRKTRHNNNNISVDPENDQSISSIVSTLPVASPASMMHELAATVGRVMRTPITNTPNTRSALFTPSNLSPNSPDHRQSTASDNNTSSENMNIPLNSGANVVPAMENISSLATSDAVVGMLLQMQEQLKILMADRKVNVSGDRALPVHALLPIPSDTRISIKSNRTQEEENYPLTDFDNSAMLKENIKIEHINRKKELKSQIAALRAELNELPLSDPSSSSSEDESEKKGRKSTENDDSIVYDHEEEDSYMKWLLLRERLFPIKKYPKLYSTRHTLLSYAGRVWEYIRTLVSTRGNSKLFPSVWVQKYKYEATQMNLATYPKIRKVESRSLVLPIWSVDERDIILSTRNITDNDIPPHNFTLSELPTELGVDPPRYRKITMLEAGVEDILKYYMKRLKSNETSREPNRGIMSPEKAIDAFDDDSVSAPNFSTPAKDFAVKRENEMPSLLPDPYKHPELFLKTRKDQTEVKKESLLYPPRPGPLASNTQTVKKHVLDPIFARFDENTQNIMRVLRITTPHERIKKEMLK